MKNIWPIFWLLTAGATSFVFSADPPPLTKIAPAVYQRTVFLGDSITDGNTYPLLVRGALQQADLPSMVAINAGIGGDTAAGMQKRLARDVLDHRPTLATLSAGANDVLRGVTVEDYERRLRAIANELREAKIPLVLLTPNIMAGKLMKKADEGLKAYETAIRRVATDFGLRVAEVRQRQEEAQIRGVQQLAADDLHPNYEGQRSIARAVLDALGYTELTVPERPQLSTLAGIISPWQMRPWAGKEPLPHSDSLRAAKVDGSWKELVLPLGPPAKPVESDNRWLDDFRQLGGAIALPERIGAGNRFLGLATIESDQKKKVQFNTGADLQLLWLNGQLLYQPVEIRGWHIGRQSVAAELAPGKNTVLILCGSTFFLSVTDGPMWGE